MAQRSSFSKLQRDRDKQAKAAAKRDRRQNRDSAPEREDGPETADSDGPTVEVEASEILEQVEQLQREYDAEVIDFEIYEKRKAELLSKIQI